MSAFCQSYLDQLDKTKIIRHCKKCPDYNEFCEVAHSPAIERFEECDELQECF